MTNFSSIWKVMTEIYAIECWYSSYQIAVFWGWFLTFRTRQEKNTVVFWQVVYRISSHFENSHLEVSNMSMLWWFLILSGQNREILKFIAMTSLLMYSLCWQKSEVFPYFIISSFITSCSYISSFITSCSYISFFITSCSYTNALQLTTTLCNKTLLMHEQWSHLPNSQFSCFALLPILENIAKMKQLSIQKLF